MLRLVGNGVVGISSSISITLDSCEIFNFFAVFSAGSGETETLKANHCI